MKYNIQKVLLYMCSFRLDGGDQIFEIKNWDTEFFFYVAIYLVVYLGGLVTLALTPVFLERNENSF